MSIIQSILCIALVTIISNPAQARGHSSSTQKKHRTAPRAQQHSRRK